LSETSAANPVSLSHPGRLGAAQRRSVVNLTDVVSVALIKPKNASNY